MFQTIKTILKNYETEFGEFDLFLITTDNKLTILQSEIKIALCILIMFILCDKNLTFSEQYEFYFPFFER
jgi:hypothetical protein